MVLLVAISKFNTYSISSNCRISDKCFEKNCKKKVHTFRGYHCKLRTRYPYAYYINLSFLGIAYITILLEIFRTIGYVEEIIKFSLLLVIPIAIFLLCKTVAYENQEEKNNKN